MGQTQSKQESSGNVKEEEVSELVRCSSDLSISDKSYASMKIKKKKNHESHRGVFHGGIKKKRMHKSDMIRNHNSSNVCSSSSSSIMSNMSSSSSNSFFNSEQNDEPYSVCSTSLEEVQFEKPKKAIKKIDWERNPDAWAYLYSFNTATCNPELLKYRYNTNERPGYLIGSGGVCDIRINDKDVHERHCLIYPEVYVDFNNNSKLQICLRDMRRHVTVPIQVNGTNLKAEYTREPYPLNTNDIVRLSSNTAFRIIFAPSEIKIATFDDDYKLGPMIGTSLYSKISVAHLRKNREVQHAVKMIRKDSFKKRPDILKQFMQEVAILMSLEKHPGIVGIIKVYDEAENFHLVMEYFPEGDLYSFIVNIKQLPEEHTRIIFIQLFSAVNFLHQAGVVHRDIKPENILMVSKAKLQVKICDFGLATLHQNKRTLLHSYCGSPSYVAPEIISLHGETESGYGNLCDLWSLGVVLYVCLCGHPPFYGDDYVSIDERILSGSLEHCEQLPIWNSLSLSVRSLIRRLLKVKPEERLTAAEALDHPWIIANSVDN
ncbi:hypothetical protein G6F46_005849 [Rhizopus delemar]|uniref:Protein kinase domain-containing protein n=2 Tax=Rhizopus TaxID=4842 RepID=A0A9P6Z3X0_9FUNG|nr:hypothetical protein G6F55_004521 [Rhizopus delemar]KAG1546483.1 hypothetical protein G6F51_004851 [Rhizopus arrhizus]KAG1498147.1 hypothetical protein G6F54_005283 [Rhizopus delemar]KAG1511802.1 hypothetical protein G6F53_005667 [Rhizopus delemar]KAG1520919.1 hypothetical protein G6F52_007216 [Rhizopus delemar]